jgi:arylsulfatase A
LVNIELGYDKQPQLYNLSTDIGETNNLAKKYPKKVKELKAKLEEIKKGSK